MRDEDTSKAMMLLYKVFGHVNDRLAKVMVLMAGFPESEMSSFSRVIPEFTDEYRVHQPLLAHD